MKKEVSPIVAAIGILLLLVSVQVFYWQKLSPEKLTTPAAVSRRGRGGPPETPSAPVGLASFRVSTLAGTPTPGFADGRGATAQFSGPAAVAVDAAGAVYVADSRNHAIRVIQPDGTVTRLAGAPGQDGLGGYADGPGRVARFSAPAGIALLPDGGVLVADTGNHRLRKIDAAGTVSALAGCDTPKGELGRFLGGYRDGPAAQAQFRYPVGVVADARGVIYVADAGNHCVRRLAEGQVSTVPASGGKMKAPTAVALAPDGRLWVSDTEGGALWSGPAEGPLQPWKPKGGDALGQPSGLVVTGQQAGTPACCAYVLDAKTHCLYQLGSDGAHLVAGQQGRASYVDGTGDAARFAMPAGLAARAGTLFVADFGDNCIRTVAVGSRRKEEH